ncbi:hypothetical protein GCM10022291_04130 [Postechiella marina]|uniref:UspA domain-containing protein n=1 Tax=Postechiella marina TaxID=943941 RepID=A0ABP8C0J2_9FLAO
MKNILLPTDFSKNSINAIDYAMQFFKKERCKLYILNVQKVSTFITDDMMTVAASSSVYNTIIDVSKKSIANIIATMQSAYNNPRHKFCALVDFDNFVDAIKQVSKIHDIDLIIMGTKGATGLNKIIFGSNTVHAMQCCNVPVLAVPNGCKFTELKSIALMGDNFLSFHVDKLKPLKRLLFLRKANLTALLIKGALKPNRCIFKSNFFNALFSKVSCQSLEVSNNNLVEKVDHYLSTNNIQMFALLTENHSFLNRLFRIHKVETLGFNINIPFYIMHA